MPQIKKLILVLDQVSIIELNQKLWLRVLLVFYLMKEEYSYQWNFGSHFSWNDCWQALPDKTARQTET
jgi:hypothetical protein